MRKYLWVVMFSVCIMLLVGCGAKSNKVTLTDGRQANIARGKVVNIKSDVGMLIISSRGNETSISFTDAIEMQNFQSMAEIKKGDPLKVIYTQDDLGKSAVSVKKLPAGSCDN